jgi:hypothetical protein
LALAHNLAASLLPPVPAAPDDDDDEDTADDDGAFPNEKDGVADVEAGVGAAADDEDKLCPNENGTDGVAAVTGAGAAFCPKENPVTPAAGAGAEAVVVAVDLTPNAKEGVDIPLVKSTFAKGFAFTGASPSPAP